MRDQLIKVKFTCEGTRPNNKGFCGIQMILEGTLEDINYYYKEAGWGWIDPHGIRQLCGAKHVEKLITKR